VTATGTILAGCRRDIPSPSRDSHQILALALDQLLRAGELSSGLLLAVTHVEGTGRRDVAWRAHFWIEAAAGIGFLSMIAMHLELWAFRRQHRWSELQ